LRLLLDTHVLLWWWADDEALPQHLRAVIADRANTVWVSAASAWEIATKSRRGRLPGASDVVSRFGELVALGGFAELPVAMRHGIVAGSYDNAHRDPFDRMLAAQAEVEQMAIVTRDAELRKFPCAVVWSAMELDTLRGTSAAGV
jgi:PIN domain nuclease of toxin-antitoxin system